MLISVPATLVREGQSRMAIRPVFATPEEAVADIPDGASIALGGFSAALGCPIALLRAVADSNQAKDLTFIGNGVPQGATGKPEQPFFFVEPSRVRRVICSFPAAATSRRGVSPYEAAFLDGTTELELVPQGTLAERLRAGGAGIPAFFTPTGAGTRFEEGKEVREFDGRRYVMERALTPDFALVKALRADRLGNLFYRNTARAFNPPMAMAAKVTIAEVEELVEPGEIPPEMIATPGIYVHRLVVVKR
jgi:3-oxoacid CoA-transferase A subunit